jgi:hypothetical protein
MRGFFDGWDKFNLNPPRMDVSGKLASIDDKLSMFESMNGCVVA